jgi:hypothetical protein
MVGVEPRDNGRDEARGDVGSGETVRVCSSTDQPERETDLVIYA